MIILRFWVQSLPEFIFFLAFLFGFVSPPSVCFEMEYFPGHISSPRDSTLLCLHSASFLHLLSVFIFQVFACCELQDVLEF